MTETKHCLQRTQSRCTCFTSHYAGDSPRWGQAKMSDSVTNKTAVRYSGSLIGKTIPCSIATSSSRGVSQRGHLLVRGRVLHGAVQRLVVPILHLFIQKHFMDGGPDGRGVVLVVHCCRFTHLNKHPMARPRRSARDSVFNSRVARTILDGCTIPLIDTRDIQQRDAPGGRGNSEQEEACLQEGKYVHAHKHEPP